MDTLPAAPIDIIVNQILNNTPRTQHAIGAAWLRNVGNQQCTAMAQKMWELMEPGCTNKAQQTYQQLVREHQYLQHHLEEELANIQPQVTIPPSLNSQSRVADLKKFAKQIGCRVSGTKEVIWSNICAKVQVEEEEAEEKRTELRLKKEHPPVLTRCFLSQETKTSIKEMQQRRITATTAKREYMLNDNDLDSLPCRLARNPHWGRPMRLYKLADVELMLFEKHGGIEEQEAVRQKRANTTAKRKRTIESQEQSFVTKLEEQGVDYHLLTVYAPDLTSLGHNKRAFQQVRSAWDRLVVLRTALTARGCDLREDSRLCCSYIAHNEGSVEYIAGMMQEMKFFFQHTDYANILSGERIVDELVDQVREWDGDRIDWDETNHEASQLAKREAVEEWLESHRPEECPDFPRRFLNIR